MRLSILTILIALPAAAYAAVCPQQFSIDFDLGCVPRGGRCSDANPCCGFFKCMSNGNSPRVRINAHSPRLMLDTEINTGMYLKDWTANQGEVRERG